MCKATQHESTHQIHYNLLLRQSAKFLEIGHIPSVKEASAREALHVPEFCRRLLSNSGVSVFGGDEPHAVSISDSSVIGSAVFLSAAGAKILGLNSGQVFGRCICREVHRFAWIELN